MNPNSTLWDTTENTGFFLVFFSYQQNGYVWCQLPENWQKSSKQAIQITMFLI